MDKLEPDTNYTVRVAAMVQRGVKGVWSAMAYAKTERSGKSVRFGRQQHIAPWSFRTMFCPLVVSRCHLMSWDATSDSYACLSVPRHAPYIARTEALDAQRIRVDWTIRNGQNISAWRLSYRLQNESMIQWPHEPSDQGQIVLGVDDPQQHSFVLRNLRPICDYRITVAAGNEHGFGPESLAVVTTTKEEGTACVLSQCDCLM